MFKTDELVKLLVRQWKCKDRISVTLCLAITRLLQMLTTAVIHNERCDLFGILKGQSSSQPCLYVCVCVWGGGGGAGMNVWSSCHKVFASIPKQCNSDLCVLAMHICNGLLNEGISPDKTKSRIYLGLHRAIYAH